MDHLTLHPFLLFDGTCAEAMTFYEACFTGELTIVRVGDTPMKHSMPEALHQKVVHARLKSAAIEFSATDWLHPTRVPRQGNTVAMNLSGGPAELRQVFDKLSQGADPTLLDDLRDMPFGLYGHLADRYGVHWFFNGRVR